MYRERLTIETRGRGTYEITRQVQHIVERSEIAEGFCHLFVHHTSASLIVCENADPTVRRDLEEFAAKLCTGRRSIVPARLRRPGRHAGPHPINLDADIVDDSR